MATKVVE